MHSFGETPILNQARDCDLATLFPDVTVLFPNVFVTFVSSAVVIVLVVICGAPYEQPLNLLADVIESWPGGGAAVPTWLHNLLVPASEKTHVL